MLSNQQCHAYANTLSTCLHTQDWCKDLPYSNALWWHDVDVMQDLVQVDRVATLGMCAAACKLKWRAAPKWVVDMQVVYQLREKKATRATVYMQGVHESPQWMGAASVQCGLWWQWWWDGWANPLHSNEECSLMDCCSMCIHVWMVQWVRWFSMVHWTRQGVKIVMTYQVVPTWMGRMWNAIMIAKVWVSALRKSVS